MIKDCVENAKISHNIYGYSSFPFLNTNFLFLNSTIYKTALFVLVYLK